jgi:hypothetical protein
LHSEHGLGVRTFTPEDQAHFAELTGDRNPMHLDATYARRTQAGAPVVHGMHAALWALDLWARSEPRSRPTGLKARFEKFMPVGQPVETRLSRDGVDIDVGGVRAAALLLSFAAPSASEPLHSDQERQTPVRAADLDLSSFPDMAGAVPIHSAPSRFNEAFPAFSALVGQEVVSHLAMLSTVVGMHCPGLHSIFSKLNVEFRYGVLGSHLHFRVRKVQPLFRLLDVELGGQVVGSLQAFVRKPPVEQAGSETLRDVVQGRPYAGTRVLVVGGSRGLGELVAKLSALGGAHVTITYALGAGDAEKVACDIRAAGGSCEVRHLDVRAPLSDKKDLAWPAYSHVYYFATPQIFKQRASLYQEEELAVCFDVHVSAFHRLCERLMRDRREPLRVFYPSSVAINEGSIDVLEYVMAKASAEMLCAAMSKAWPLFRPLVTRLPRIETDQTATVLPVKSTPPLEALLPILESMNAAT